MAEQNKLKKVLGLGDALGIGIGQIIGAGIMILTGISIEITGAGTPIAFVVACVWVICPTLILGAQCSAAPATGGLYTYVRDYLGKKTSFLYLVLFVAGQLVLAMFALTFAEYTVSLIPSWNPTVVAFVIMTVCFVLNVLGLNVAAKFQNIMVIVLLAALLLFIIFGMPKVDYTVFSQPNAIMPNGFIAFLTATSLLTFATSGACFLSELGGEIKNPGKTVPRAMIISTILVGVFYAFIGIVAVGVLPIEEVAGQSLVKVANAVLPGPLFIVFVIGGGMFAVATTLNGSFTWCTKALLVAAREGWLPKQISSVSRFGTPWVLLIVFYIIGSVPILTGWDIRTIAMLGNGVSLVFFIFPTLAAYRLYTKTPDLVEKAAFKLKPIPLYIVTTIALVTTVLAAWLNLSDITDSWILMLILVVGAIIYANIRESYLEKKGTPITAVKEL